MRTRLDPSLLSLVLATALAAAVAAAAAAAVTEPGPPTCHPDCAKHGNCGEDGMCSCPFGRLGEACEIDFLAPCSLGNGTLPYCDVAAAHSCECLRRCRAYLCGGGATASPAADTTAAHEEGGTASGAVPSCAFARGLEGRACYEREGVAPDEQFSRVPDKDEEGVLFFESDTPDAPRINRTQALLYNNLESLPISACGSKCFHRGYCMRWATEEVHAAASCHCHRGFWGVSCELERSGCYLSCNGRGKCIDQICHCEPPNFSVGCSRNMTYPQPSPFQPSPVNLKIYMYELPTRLAYEHVPFLGYEQRDTIDTAYHQFMEHFLLSPVRTQDPSAANLFFVPVRLYSSSNASEAHLDQVLSHIQAAWPFFNRTGGRDHLLWAPSDHGSCFNPAGPARAAIKIVHWAAYHKPGGPQGPATGAPAPAQGVGWEFVATDGCFDPLRDVVAPPLDPLAHPWLKTTTTLPLEEQLAGKKRLFWSGDLLFDKAGSDGVQDSDLHSSDDADAREGQEANSSSSRSSRSGMVLLQVLREMSQKWDDEEFKFAQQQQQEEAEEEAPAGQDGQQASPSGEVLEAALRSAKFCLVLPGHGWVTTIVRAAAAACVPVIIQDHVAQPFEGLLPYELFSLRLDSRVDLPHLPSILHGVNEQQYQEMLQQLVRYSPAFVWDPASGGQAFAYTVAALRRRHMNVQALYVGT